MGAKKIPVLVVEDEEMLLKLYRELLEKHGVNVLEAMTGQDAIQLCNEHQPPVIISDTAVPGMNGLDLLEKSLSANPKTSFIFASTFADRLVYEALKKGAEAVFEKTGPMPNLDTLLHDLLQSTDFNDRRVGIRIPANFRTEIRFKSLESEGTAEDASARFDEEMRTLFGDELVSEPMPTFQLGTADDVGKVPVDFELRYLGDVRKADLAAALSPFLSSVQLDGENTDSDYKVTAMFNRAPTDEPDPWTRHGWYVGTTHLAALLSDATAGAA